MKNLDSFNFKSQINQQSGFSVVYVDSSSSGKSQIMKLLIERIEISFHAQIHFFHIYLNELKKIVPSNERKVLPFICFYQNNELKEEITDLISYDDLLLTIHNFKKQYIEIH